jgi:hypothetical protein
MRRIPQFSKNIDVKLLISRDKPEVLDNYLMEILSDHSLSTSQVVKILMYNLDVSSDYKSRLLFHVGRRLSQLYKAGKISVVRSTPHKKWYTLSKNAEIKNF